MLSIQSPSFSNFEFTTTDTLHDLTVLKLVCCKINEKKANEYFNGLNLPQLSYLDISRNELIEPKECWFSGFTNLRTLILRNIFLKTTYLFQFEVFSNLEVLDVSENTLNTLYEGVFSKLKNLKKLLLTRNRISRLDANVFKGLENLEVLLLENICCSITSVTIDKEAFNGLNKLRELKLSYNDFGSIHDETFSYTPNLVSLNLAGNKLNLKKTLFSSLKNLKFLSLRENLNSKDQFFISSLDDLLIDKINF